MRIIMQTKLQLVAKIVAEAILRKKLANAGVAVSRKIKGNGK